MVTYPFHVHLLSAQIKYFIPTLKLKTLRPLPLKSLLLLGIASLLLFLMGVFVILTTCAHVYFENTISNIDTETRSVIYGIGIHTVSSLSPQYCMIQISWGRSPVYSMILFGK